MHKKITFLVCKMFQQDVQFMSKKKRIIFLACDLKKREINISEKKTYTGTFDQVSTSETDNCLPLINEYIHKCINTKE